MSRVVLLELFVQSDDTLAFVLRDDRDEPRLLRIPAGSAQLQAWATALRAGIEEDAPETEATDAQHPLQPLLDAVAQDTEAGDVICVVPHGPLHRVPFHALAVEGEPLIRRNPVVYAPSASVLAGIVERERSREWDDPIVAGNTRGDLPFANDEAVEVAGILSVQAVLGRQATRRRLMAAISASRHPRILHLACHGKFDLDDALLSGILTAPGAGDSDEVGAVLTAQDLLDLRMTADLVVLSACESGISELRPGDELMGLTRALLVAGSRTVLASLWRVDDRSTALLMRAFYEGLVRDRLSKAEALRRAQCQLMDSMKPGAAAGVLQASPPTAASSDDAGGFSDRKITAGAPRPNEPRFSGPRHWAAFTLVGDWR